MDGLRKLCIHSQYLFLLPVPEGGFLLCLSIPISQQYQQQLGQKFGVPGRVTQNGAVWRIQLGPFASKAEASTLQQRLQTEAQLQSFITTAQ